MIWEAASDDAFEDCWKARAAHLANGPTMAFAAAKRVIRNSWNNDLASQLAEEASEQGDCGQSRDFREGVLSFVEKRKPSFEGR